MQFGGFKTTVELHDLGKVDPKWAGILSPLYSQDFVKRYIHRQFLEEASTYVEKFHDPVYFKHLLLNAQKYYSLDSEGPLRILDIGSGSGNTIFALMELYPDAQIAATDLSLPLLKALKDHYEAHYSSHTCTVIQQNAEEMIFEPGSIDFVVGGAILHHLFDPEKAIDQAYKVLKPGGVALFFEPFEIGNLLITMILKQLIWQNKSQPLIRKLRRQGIPAEVIQLFKSLCVDFEVRIGEDKSVPVFEKLDDKWLFTRSYFERIQQKVGFRELTIYPLHSTASPFLANILAYLQIVLGLDESALPAWALEYIREMDAHFSAELRSELLVEAGVVFKK